MNSNEIKVAIFSETFLQSFFLEKTSRIGKQPGFNQIDTISF